MTTQTPVVKSWTEKLPLIVVIMAVGLVVTFLVINPLPDLSRSENAISINNSNVSQVEIAAAQTVRFPILHSSNAVVQPFLDRIATYKAVEEAASLQRNWDASAARLTGMANHYAQLKVDAAAQKFMVRLNEYKAAVGIERGWNASAARMTAQARAYVAMQKEQAFVQKFLAQIAEYKLRRGWEASAARLTGLAVQYHEGACIQEFLAKIDAYKLRRGWEASAARLTGLAVQYHEGAFILDFLAKIDAYKLRRGWEASTARLTGMAEAYLGN
jgi:hypothetical protein